MLICVPTVHSVFLTREYCDRLSIFLLLFINRCFPVLSVALLLQESLESALALPHVHVRDKDEVLKKVRIMAEEGPEALLVRSVLNRMAKIQLYLIADT